MAIFILRSRRNIVFAIFATAFLVLWYIYYLLIYHANNENAITSHTTRANDFKMNAILPKEKLGTNKKKQRTDVVILLTMRRSGSSIVGSIFNERTDITYFYEPLFPFDERPCDSQVKERVEVLNHISRCQLEKLPSLYAQGFNLTNRNDIYASCKVHNICFATGNEKCSHFLARDIDICSADKNGRQSCPKPIDLNTLNKHCSQSLLVAMKVIYLCKLEWLVPLLEDQDYNVKVVHLVRDPRATINSRRHGRPLHLNWVRVVADAICEQLEPNLHFADETILNSHLKEKYFRVRFEDFASNPIAKTQEIYDFAGINMNKDIKTFLKSSTSKSNDSKLRKEKPQGLERNPDEVLSAWRHELNFEEVSYIQKRCSSAIKILGYKVFNNSEEFKKL